MSKKTIALLVLAFFVLTLGLAGCSKQETPAQSKVLRVGAEATFPPFEFQDEKTKEYTGFDIDLAKAVGKQMGYQVEIQNMGFDGLIPALQTGSIDMVASAMSITDERSQKVNFSQPYYKSGLSIVVKKDNTTINSFKDLEGKRIAVQIGTTSAKEAQKIKNAQVREFNSNSEAYMELVNGGADAVVNDLPVNQYYLAQTDGKDAKLVGEVANAEDYGLAVAKNNKELADKVNKALDELKKNGEYDKIYQKWFGNKK
ncbi:MAG: basic amino acid ABC transporter substrate-binding protein [Veillonellaceae bacterium]|nr:basic amino acid ABC transporter substrate-binding protein [Veillonellaceae bacterium]